MSIDGDKSRILLELLAFTDAIHEPVRVRDHHRPGIIHELRSRYQTGGVAWSSEALSEAGRKQAQRALENLAGAKLVDVVRNVGRTALVRPSDHGEAIARRLGGDCTNIMFAIEQMHQLHKLSGRPGTAWSGHVPEHLVAGIQWGDDGQQRALADVQADLVPALVRRWVEAETTIHGHAWYRLTDSGRRVADGGVELPSFEGLPEPTDAGGEEYVRLLTAAKHRIDAMTRQHPGELGIFPWPVRPALVEGGAA